MNTETGILICTEREDEQRGLRVLLRSIGFDRVTATGNASDAEDALRSGKIGVMVVDTGFDGMGLRFAREERRRAMMSQAELPGLIIVSDTGDAVDAAGLPDDAAVIVRPYAQAELVKLIFEAVNRVGERQETGSGARQNEELEVSISGVLHSVGIPAHIKGYTYLRRAIGMTVREPDVINFVTKTLYPTVALEYDTTPTRVERAIRHAIEVAWDRGDVDVLDSYFGYTISRQRGKPTNSEFIAMIADKIRLGVIR